MTSTFLFVLWAGGGNAPPQIALAARLAETGHRVKMLAPAALRERVEVAGLEFEPYRATPEHDEADPARSLIRDFEIRSPVAAAKAQRDRLLADLAEPVAADVLAILDRDTADIVAFDSCCSAPCLRPRKRRFRPPCSCTPSIRSRLLGCRRSAMAGHHAPVCWVLPGTGWGQWRSSACG